MKKKKFYIIDVLVTAVFFFYINAFLVDQVVVYSPLKMAAALVVSMSLVLFPLYASQKRFSDDKKKIKA